MACSTDTSCFSKVNLQWEDWLLLNVVSPFSVLVVLSLLFELFFQVGHKYIHADSNVVRFAGKYIGSYGKPPRYPIPFVVMSSLHVLCSFINLATWVVRTYSREATMETDAVLAGAACLDALAWLLYRVHGHCRCNSLWEINSCVTMATVVPTVLSAGQGSIFFVSHGRWLSLHFLSIYSALYGFGMIQNTRYFQYSRVQLQTVTVLLLQVMTVIIVMAGIIFTLELLGDPSFLVDSFIETAHGDAISFAQMVYFIIVSITTVGYGDFAPRTMLSRVLMSLFVVIGVTSIYIMQYSFTTKWSRQREGSGRYTPRSRHESHVVILLPVGHASKLSALIAGFLKEVFKDENPTLGDDSRRLHVVLFSDRVWSADSQETFQGFLTDHGFPVAVQQSISFVVGDLGTKSDMHRVSFGSSRLTYLFADIESDDPDGDDTLTIFNAKLLQTTFPNIRLRVMLLSPDSKELAVQAGLDITRCFSTREIKANMLAQNVRCHGLLPSIMMMLKSVDVKDEESFLRAQDSLQSRDLARSGSTLLNYARNSFTELKNSVAATDEYHDEKHQQHELCDPWYVSYFQGLQRNLYGFELSENYAGLRFGQLAHTMYQQSSCVLLAVHDENMIQICPQQVNIDELSTGQICFAIARRHNDIKPFTLAGGKGWQQSLMSCRDELAQKAREVGNHFSAAKVVGRKIRESLANLSEEQSQRQKSFEDITRGISLQQHGLDRARALRKTIKADQELVVLVVSHGAAWQQVTTMIDALRAYYLVCPHPIIVLSEVEAPARLVARCESGVVFLTGSCLQVKSLIDAGVLEARAIVVMTGEAKKRNKLLVRRVGDVDVLLCAEELECWCGISAREVFTTFELRDNVSLKFLPQLKTTFATTIDSLLNEHAYDAVVEQEGEDSDAESIEEQANSTLLDPQTVTLKSSLPPSARQQNSMRAGEESSGESILFHPRFAAGQVFTPELWGVMLGKMIYMPAVIELVEALVMPQLRMQSAFPWQIRVPDDMAGGPMSTLFHFLTIQGADSFDNRKGRVEPDVCRLPGQIGEVEDRHKNAAGSSPTTSKNSARSMDSDRSSLGAQKGVQGPAVPIALYRARTDVGPFNPAAVASATAERLHSGNHNAHGLAHGTGGFYYAILAPPKETTLRSTDWVLVLGSRGFGKKMHKLGLLRNGLSADAQAAGLQTRSLQRRTSTFDGPTLNVPDGVEDAAGMSTLFKGVLPSLDCDGNF